MALPDGDLVRRIRISAVFHVASRRDSRSHAATRVIRRHTNRRHMIGDHYGPTAGRATVLARAVDEIRGTLSVRLIPLWQRHGPLNMRSSHIGNRRVLAVSSVRVAQPDHQDAAHEPRVAAT